MAGKAIDEVVVELLRSLNKGQLILLCESIRQAGGQVEIDPTAFARAAAAPNPQLSVETTEGPIRLKLM